MCIRDSIEAHELDPRHVADVQNVLDLFDAAVFELGDVDHAVVARGNLNERADRQDADNLAIIPVSYTHLDVYKRQA